MPQLFLTVLYIFIAMSLTGAIMVVIDKYNAIHSFNRISEATLFFFGIFGGAFLMFLSMKLVHHKTLKPKFMISFPLLAMLHIIILFLCYR